MSEVPPPVPGPTEIEVGTTYRFPTKLPDGSPAWLVGVFATDGEAPAPVPLGDRALALHGARVTSRGNTAPWALDAGETPVLSVSTMMTDRLDGLLETPEQLRSHARVILDLRGNGGGSDTVAQQWVSAFAPQVYRWHGGVDLSVGPGAQADRLQAWTPSTFGRRVRRSPWNGELTVLVDGQVASSGETFTMLASQIPDAVLVGVNTLGCTRVGNVSEHEPLPNTRISATFGHTRFDFADVIPVAEGRGIFPDLWLDELDPVAFVRALPATR